MDFDDIELAFGYCVTAQERYEERSYWHLCERHHCKVRRADLASATLAARLERAPTGNQSEFDGAPARVSVEYRLFEETLFRECLGPEGRPLTLDALRTAMTEGWTRHRTSSFVDFPAPLTWSPKGRELLPAYGFEERGKRALKTRYAESKPARAQAEAFATRLLSMGGKVWRPCPPPAYALVDGPQYAERTVSPCMPDFDCPELLDETLDWRGYSAPSALVAATSDPALLAEAARASEDGVTVRTDGTVTVMADLPRTDDDRTSAYLLLVAAKRHGPTGSAWEHMDPESRLHHAKFEATLARYLGRSRLAATREDVTEAAAALGEHNPHLRYARLWVALERTASREEDMEADLAALAP